MITTEAEAKQVIKEQFQRELEVLSRLIAELKLSLSPEELLEYSGLSVGRYTVKGYTYLKLIGVLTGERSNREERWLIKRLDKGGVERKRKLRRKAEHLLNVRKTEESEIAISQLITYWRRAKALQRWLEEAQEI